MQTSKKLADSKHGGKNTFLQLSFYLFKFQPYSWSLRNLLTIQCLILNIHDQLKQKKSVVSFTCFEVDTSCCFSRGCCIHINLVSWNTWAVCFTTYFMNPIMKSVLLCMFTPWYAAHCMTLAVLLSSCTPCCFNAWIKNECALECCTLYILY